MWSGSSASCDAAGWCICHRDGVEWLHQPISSSGSLMLLNLSTSSLSSATMMSRSSAWLHFTQLLSLLSSSSSARLALPAVWDLESCMFLWELSLHHRILSSDCRGHCSPPSGYHKLLLRDQWPLTQPFFWAGGWLHPPCLSSLCELLCTLLQGVGIEDGIVKGSKKKGGADFLPSAALKTTTWIHLNVEIMCKTLNLKDVF